MLKVDIIQAGQHSVEMHSLSGQSLIFATTIAFKITHNKSSSFHDGDGQNRKISVENHRDDGERISHQIGASNAIFPLPILTIPGRWLCDADPERLADIGQGSGPLGHAFPTMLA
jgi:hypothetical protein